MAKTTYTVPQVPGSKRTSDRPYTHAVIGRRNNKRARDAIQNEPDENHASNFRYSLDISRMTAGQMRAANHGRFHYPVEQSDIDSAIRALDGATTLAEYAAKVRARRLADEIRCHGEADTGPLEVLRWSMSYANASKGLGEFSHRLDVAVVECQPLAKK